MLAKGTPRLPHTLTIPLTCFEGLHWCYTEVVKVREHSVVMEETQQYLQHNQSSRR